MTEEVAIPPTLYDQLRELARHCETAYYSDIAHLLGIDTRGPAFGAQVGRLLDAVNRAEHAAGRPLLSAVVIAKQTGMPGNGFFTGARALGVHTGHDDRAYWQEELRRVCEYWSRH
jgi:hypothetical protein